MRSIYSYIITLLFFTGCQTIDFPEPDNTSNPQFFINGILNGQPWSIVAGENDYFMDGYFTKDDLNIYTFSAHLRKKDCNTSCSNSLLLEIRDQQPSSGLPEVNKSLAVGDREIAIATQDSVKFHISHEVECRGNGDSTYTVQWKLNERRTPQLPNLVFDLAKKNELAMIVSHRPTGINVTLSQQLTIENGGAITVNILKSANGYKITVVSGNEQRNPVKSITWSNGRNDKELELEDFPSTLKGEIILSNGGHIQMLIEAPEKVEFNGALCAIKYAMEAEKIKATNAPRLKAATIKYIDPQGTLFSTQFAKETGKLIIEKVEDFPSLANGYKTKKVSVSFSAKLYDEKSTKSVQMDNIRFVCAMAYPD